MNKTGDVVRLLKDLGRKHFLADIFRRQQWKAAGS